MAVRWPHPAALQPHCRPQTGGREDLHTAPCPSARGKKPMLSGSGGPGRAPWRPDCAPHNLIYRGQAAQPRRQRPPGLTRAPRPQAPLRTARRTSGGSWRSTWGRAPGRARAARRAPQTRARAPPARSACTAGRWSSGRPRTRSSSTCAPWPTCRACPSWSAWTPRRSRRTCRAPRCCAGAGRCRRSSACTSSARASCGMSGRRASRRPRPTHVPGTPGGTLSGTP